MNSKLPAFLLGLVAGALVVTGVFTAVSRQKAAAAAEAAAAQSSAQAAAASAQTSALNDQLTSAKARIQKLESDNLQLATKVQDFMKQADAAPKPASKPQKNGLAAMFGGDDNGDTNGAGSAMRQMMKAAIEQQMEGKVTRMKSKLNLSPDQEKAVREILSRASNQGQEMAEKMLKGDAKATDVAKAPLNTESEIRALLSPEQRTGYEQLQQEEISNNARLIANSELLQMQQTLGLDQAQQDKVFAALCEQSKTQLAGAQNGTITDTSGNPMKTIDDMFQHKLDALKGVLTDDQFASYKKFQEQQLKMIRSFLPKDGKSGDVTVPQIQEIPKP